MAYNLEPRTIKENLLGLIGKNPHAEPRPANTREECFLADIAENGGGGGGLPPYTSADKGKVLTVGEGSGGETVDVVPEQIVTIPGSGGELYAVLSGNIANFIAGSTATLTVNSTEYQAEVFDDGGVVTAFFPIDETDPSAGAYSVYVVEDELYLTVRPATEVPVNYAISMTAVMPITEMKWETVSGALIVKATGEAQYSAEDGFIVNADVTPAKIQACFQPDTARPVYILFPQFSFDGTDASYDYSDPLSNFMMPLRQLMSAEEVTYDNYKYTFGSLGAYYFLSMIEENI